MEDYESGPGDMFAVTPRADEHPTSVIQHQSGVIVHIHYTECSSI